MGSQRKNLLRRTVKELSIKLRDKRRIAFARGKDKRKALLARKRKTFRCTNDRNLFKRCLQEKPSSVFEISELTLALGKVNLANSMICSENDSKTDENCARNGFSSASSDSLCSTPPRPRPAPKSAKPTHRYGKQNSAAARERREQRRLRAQRNKSDTMTRSPIQPI